MADATRYLLPKGFQFGTTKAGLKKSGRTDFALIVADAPASAAAVFTANRVTAAPLIIDKANLRATGGRVRVAAINAGNANCAAGEPGMAAARATCIAAARVFGCSADEVIPASPGMAARLSAEPAEFHEAAQAILTTDTVEKTAFALLAEAGADGAVMEV